ncbi:MAG TPA: S9 family peptidase [Dyella sp.]|uniref:alpha/beta hydrolase family protein n=1 Tax=Dyella sp. TaxID=1869338 RepID=UPI002C18DCD3|nr:S9 family peptidase [Dyella sp.]HTV86416.1 S9 family peptidase [Dyella sp.]
MDKRKWGFLSVLLCLVCASYAWADDGATTAPSPHQLPPIGNFIRQPDFSQVSMSPDGTYIGTLVPEPGNPYGNLLAILDARTGKAVHLLRSGAHALIHDYFWVGDKRIVATIARQQGGVDTPIPTGELFAIDVDGGGQIDLFGYRASPTQPGAGAGKVQPRDAYAQPMLWRPVGDNQILVEVNAFTTDPAGSLTSARMIDVRNGRSVDLGSAPARNAHLLADHAGHVRVAYANNDLSGIDVWWRPSAGAPWKVLNDPATSGVEMAPIGFNRDDSKLYVRVTHGDSPDAIEAMTLATGALTSLYQGRFADPGPLLESADGLDYYAVITQEGRRSLFYLDENSQEARLNKALAAKFPGQLVYFSSFTRDGKRAIVSVSSDRDPGDYYIFDLDTHKASHLFSAMPWIDPAHMQPMQPIELKARDGLLLHGFLTLPAGARPYPLIVLPHGGPHGIADLWQFDPEVQLLASRGYAVLQINYRGSGGYGSYFQNRGYRQWGLSMQDDLTDATRWAIDQGYADARRICIYGESYGGYAALEGAVREPDLYKCAIGYAGVYDLRLQLDLGDTRQTRMGEAYLQLALGDDRNDLLRRSPLSGAGRIKADILLIHGGDDPRAPFKNFQAFTQALDQHGKHYQTLVEPHEGHGFFLPEHQQEAYQAIIGFLDRNIGPGAAAKP